jgi:chaperonin GroEL (HSP60 family)
MTAYQEGDYVYILREDGTVLTAGRVKRQRPDGRYKVRKAGRSQVVTVPSERLAIHPQNGW